VFFGKVGGKLRERKERREREKMRKNKERE
jgi:hypothetical protein